MNARSGDKKRLDARILKEALRLYPPITAEWRWKKWKSKAKLPRGARV